MVNEPRAQALYDPNHSKAPVPSTPWLNYTGSGIPHQLLHTPTAVPAVPTVVKNSSFPGTNNPTFHIPPSSIRASVPTYHTHCPLSFPSPVHFQPLYTPTIVPNYPSVSMHPATSQPSSTAAYLHPSSYPTHPSHQRPLLTLPAASSMPHGVSRSPLYRQTSAPSSQNRNSAGLLPHPVGKIPQYSQSLGLESFALGHIVHPSVQQTAPYTGPGNGILTPPNLAQRHTPYTGPVHGILTPPKQSHATQQRLDTSRAQHVWKTN